jgi:hypothetical protein
MANIIIVFIILSLGAILYIALRNRVTELEKKFEIQNQLNHSNHALIDMLTAQVNKLTAAHNEVADYLNNAKRNTHEADFDWDDYTPFKAPKGEA